MIDIYNLLFSVCKIFYVVKHDVVVIVVQTGGTSYITKKNI